MSLFHCPNIDSLLCLQEEDKKKVERSASLTLTRAIWEFCCEVSSLLLGGLAFCH